MRKIRRRTRIVHHAVLPGHCRRLIVWMPTASLLETSFHLKGAGEDAYREFVWNGISRLLIGLEGFKDICRDLDPAL